MGSATREALAAGRAALGAAARDGLAVGTALFQVADVVGGSAQLRSALADPSADPKAKQALVSAVFKDSGPAARVLDMLTTSRWSTPDDLVAGMDELGIRAIAASAPRGVSITDELFAFATAVQSDAQLELALGSKLGADDAKHSLISSLLGEKSSAQTRAIVQHVVTHPRGRRIGQVLSRTAAIVADQAGQKVATVVTAKPLKAAQLTRLRAGLSATYGADLKLNQVIDPSIIGGVRVQVGDDVIDGSVSTRLTELRLALVG
ncbi:MAG TPA: F0F1 ATP synthase subunit delta [Microbacterium sp.]|nr:F0F1 ATP synthase subunit delta [Microbacterium sp.]